jgi:predicted ATP-dependent protease
MAADAEKLSIRLRDITDRLREADYWARQAGRDVVTGDDVQRALDARIYRADRLRERLQDEIHRGTLLIDTQGVRVGQVNGLSVVGLDDFIFGHPSAHQQCAPRKGEGSIFTRSNPAPTHSGHPDTGVPRIMACVQLAVTFRQFRSTTYGEVEGDSASRGNAPLSALAETPVKQSLAVTGSVNQHTDPGHRGE